MICITIANESRRMALVDMLNAAPQCDLLEIRLDKFQKAADLSELMGAKPKPVIMSCRRQQDGGDFTGSETERLAILRQCIIAKAEYVEIELDVADQIRPFPPSKRVISYTNMQETPADLADIYAEAQTKRPDVIKLVTLARTPEEAWPLVQILAKPAVPTIAVGLGKAGVMLSILGRKMGAPWSYAALERGMEAYPGQPTVADLCNVYHYQAITKQTRLIGVTGFGDEEYATLAALNAAFAHLELPARCLPAQVGGIRNFRKIIEAVRLAGVVVDEPNRQPIMEIVGELESTAQKIDSVDLIVHKDDKWYGYNLLCRAGVAALEATLRAKHPDNPVEKPLEGRTVMIVGTGPKARALAYGVKRRGGAVVITSRDPDDARDLAHAVECRVVPIEAIYTTLHDVLVVTPDEGEATTAAKAKVRASKGELKTGYLKPGMTVLDLTAHPRLTPLLRDARAHGCSVVAPRDVILESVALQTKLFSGKEVPRAVLEAALADLTLGDEAE